MCGTHATDFLQALTQRIIAGCWRLRASPCKWPSGKPSTKTCAVNTPATTGRNYNYRILVGDRYGAHGATLALVGAQIDMTQIGPRRH